MECLTVGLIIAVFIMIISSIIPDKLFLVKLKTGEVITVKNARVANGSLRFENSSGGVEILSQGEWLEVKEIKNV